MEKQQRLQAVKETFDRLLGYSKTMGDKLLVNELTNEDDTLGLRLSSSLYKEEEVTYRELEIGSKEYYDWLEEVVEYYEDVHEGQIYIEANLDDGCIDFWDEEELANEGDLIDMFERISNGFSVFEQ